MATDDPDRAARRAPRGSPLAKLLALYWRLCAALSPDAASALGGALGRLVGPWLKAGRVTALNLRLAFPDWPERRVRRTAARSMAQLGRVIAEFPHLGAICGDGGPSRVELVGAAILARLRRDGRPALLVSGHFANWEVLAGAAVRAGLPLTVLHALRADGAIERLVAARRVALGCRFLPADAHVQTVVAELRAGRSIGILLDQRHDEGEGVPLFGRPAPAPLAPALLALRMGLPFIPVRLERLAGCRFRLTIEEPIEPDPSLGDRRAIARDMTARVYARFETWIGERPDQWLCIKRRWPDLSRDKWRRRLARNPRLVGPRGDGAGPSGLAGAAPPD